MEQIKEQKSKRMLSVFFDEIKKLEGQIMENPSMVMSEYISSANKSEEE